MAALQATLDIKTSVTYANVNEMNAEQAVIQNYFKMYIYNNENVHYDAE